MRGVLLGTALVAGAIYAGSANAQNVQIQKPTVQFNPGKVIIANGVLLANKVQQIYSNGKRARSCSELHRILRALKTYYRYKTPLPKKWHYTILHPKKVRNPTIADMARDRLLRLRKGLYGKLCKRACTGAKPKLAYVGREAYRTNAGRFIRWKLKVVNWPKFCNQMFAPAPNLPPCGLNNNSSRSWVDIHHGTNRSRLYGFCALKGPRGLTKLWFARRVGVRPPKSVYIKIRDRKTGVVYTSNRVAIP